MRVLIADKLPPSVSNQLQAAGATVVSEPGLKGDALVAALRAHTPDVLVVRSTKVEEPHLVATQSLQLVVRAGAGVNTIDLGCASARGVFVSNCPGMNAAAVAELTLGHILNADRRIADGVAELRAGQWNKGEWSKGARGLRGRTLGVIGCGAIGTLVIQGAHALGMDVVGFDPALTPARAAALGIRRADSPVDLAAQSDVLTVHVALNDHTRGLISRAVLEAMPAGGIFVNTTRGPVVDEAALEWAVRERGLRAGLDVFCDEPNAKSAPWTHPLTALPGVYGTHHIGASTDQAQEAVAAEALRVILEWSSTGTAPNCVNLARVTPATHLLVVRHADRVGVLAGVFDLLREQSINVQAMENVVFQGAKAACARIQLDAPLSEGALRRLNAHSGIFDAAVVGL